MTTLSAPQVAATTIEAPHADDHPLHSRVLKALAAQTHLVGKNLRFEARAGRVTLHGKVRSFFLKQMAQESLRGIEGLAHIDNRMTVDWEHDAPQRPAPLVNQ
jgi:osmotically-inducible protein OsmY